MNVLPNAVRGDAAVLAVGDELLCGTHADLDTPIVAAALRDAGLSVGETAIQPDDVDAIATRLGDLVVGRRLVVTTGGLGPTDDDVTRDAIAKVAGVPLEERSAAWAAIEARFLARGIEVPHSNRRQILLPRGAELLPNALGTAPGFWVELANGTVVAALPGPPSECAGMLAAELMPRVRARLGGGESEVRAAFALFGLSESRFADLLGDWMARGVDPRMGVSARDGILAVKFVDRGAQAQARLADRTTEFRARFAAHIFAERDCSLEEVVVEFARKAVVKIAVAESCTGGRVSERLTRVPGSSAVFEAGYVTYSNRAKERTLGVPGALIDRFGAVSPEVATAMAEGALRASGADLAVAITGVAGPDGGTADKPVGHVCFGLAAGTGSSAYTCRFPPSGRARVRMQATQFALDLLRRQLLGIGFDGLGWPAGSRG